MTALNDSLPPIAPGRRTTSSVWLVITLGSLSAFGPFAIDMYLPAFPSIVADLCTSDGNVQLTLSVFLAGIAVGQLLWGTLSDHWGRRAPMLVGCGMFFFTAVVCATTHSILLLIVTRFFMGLGGSAGVVVARAVVRDMFDEHESARFYSLMMVIGGLAPIIAPSLGALLLRISTWRMIFWVVALFAALCVLGIARAVPETLPRSNRAHGEVSTIIRKYLRLFINAPYISHTLVLSFQFAALFAYIASSPTVFMGFFHKTQQQFSMYFMCNAAGIYLSGQTNRLLLRRWSPRQILLIATSLNMVVCVSLAVVAGCGVGGFPAFYCLLFFVIASLGCIGANAVAVAMKPVADQAGSASALMGMLQFVFGAASGSLVGVMHTGTPAPAVIVIGLSSLASWLTLILFARRTAH